MSDSHDSRSKRGPRSRGNSVGALVSWGVIVLIAVLLGLSQAGVLGGGDGGEHAAEPALPHAADPGSEAEPQMEEAAEAGTGEAAAATEDDPDLGRDGADAETASGAMMEVVARSVVGAPEADRAQSMGNIDLVAQTDTDRLRLAMLTGYVKGSDQAIARLDDLAKRRELREALQGDLETLRRLYAAESVSAEDAERMEERHGWFWEVAQASTTEPGSEHRQRLEKDARVTYWIASGFSLLVLLMLVASFGLFVTAIVLVAMGKIRTKYVPPAPGGSAYVETFAVFLVAFMVLSFGMTLAVTNGPEGLQRIAGPAMHALRWALLGAAAWPLLRGATWREVRDSIGWTTPRGFFREVGCGVAGYLAALPLIAVGIMITLGLVALSGRLSGEEAAMPAHPLPEMLAQAGPVEVVLLVILATLWAPIVEETFFRGALYHHLRGRLHWVLAGLASALVFAAIHPQGLFGIPALMSIAMMLAMLREWRGSLVASMTAHAVNNGVITISMLLLMKVQ